MCQLIYILDMYSLFPTHAFLPNHYRNMPSCVNANYATKIPLNFVHRNDNKLYFGMTRKMYVKCSLRSEIRRKNGLVDLTFMITNIF